MRFPYGTVVKGKPPAQKESKELNLGNFPNNQQLFEGQVQEMVQRPKSKGRKESACQKLMELNITQFGGRRVE